MSRNPSHAEVLEEWLRSKLMEVRVALPGRVEAYDAAKQTADIKPMIRDVLIDGDGGNVVESLPVLPDVRVLHPRGGGFFAAMPLRQGDFVQLIVNDRSLAQWRAKGTESDPIDLRMHDLSDVVAIPGGYPDTQPLADAEADALVVGKEGGPYLRIDPDFVHIGDKSAAAAIARADKTDDQIANLKSYIDVIADALAAYTGLVTPFAGGSLITAAKTAAGASTATTAATKGKVT